MMTQSIILIFFLISQSQPRGLGKHSVNLNCCWQLFYLETRPLCALIECLTVQAHNHKSEKNNILSEALGTWAPICNQYHHIRVWSLMGLLNFASWSVADDTPRSGQVYMGLGRGSWPGSRLLLSAATHSFPLAGPAGRSRGREGGIRLTVPKVINLIHLSKSNGKVSRPVRSARVSLWLNTAVVARPVSSFGAPP